VPLSRWLWILVGVTLAAALVYSTSVAYRYVDQALDRGGYFDPSIRDAEWHQQGQRTLSEAFPTRTVSRGGPIAVLPESPLELGGVTYEHGGERNTFAEFLDRNHTQGIVVLHRGALVYERYFEGADDGSRFTSWSVAKSFTATLVGMALADGKIRSLDDTLESYIPALRGTAYEGVTIDQALRMRSGVAFSEEYTDGGSDIASFMRGSVIEQFASADLLAAGYPRSVEPGTVFNYNTAETQILGWLVREVTQRSHAAYLEEKLWRPLGMEHDATMVLDRPGPDGVALAGCCLNASLRDWARFGQLHLQNGVWQGRRLLAESWIVQATTSDGDPEAFYGYQWWLFDEGRYSAEGVHGQFIYVDPAHDLVIAKASVWPTAWDDAMASEVMTAFAAVGRHLAGRATDDVARAP
jgi:CubicO group peptidase (beta-lactamase class C family)